MHRYTTNSVLCVLKLAWTPPMEQELRCGYSRHFEWSLQCSVPPSNPSRPYLHLIRMWGRR